MLCEQRHEGHGRDVLEVCARRGGDPRPPARAGRALHARPPVLGRDRDLAQRDQRIASEVALELRERPGVGLDAQDARGREAATEPQGSLPDVGAEIDHDAGVDPLDDGVLVLGEDLQERDELAVVAEPEPA
jgi:hypothetical protein